MTVKQTITVGAKANVERLARSRPAYLAAVEQWDGQSVVSGVGWAEDPARLMQEMIQHVGNIDRILNAAQEQINFLREGNEELRKIVTREPQQEQAGQVTEQTTQPHPSVQPAPPVAVKPQPQPASQWVCPVDNQGADGTSRKGRPYRYCPICGDVERPLA